MTALLLCLHLGDGWRSRQKGKLPEALQTVFQLFGPEVLKERLNDSMGGDIDYEAVLEEWMREFTLVRGVASTQS